MGSIFNRIKGLEICRCDNLESFCRKIIWISVNYYLFENVNVGRLA